MTENTTFPFVLLLPLNSELAASEWSRLRQNTYKARQNRKWERGKGTGSPLASCGGLKTVELELIGATSSSPEQRRKLLLAACLVSGDDGYFMIC
ncbi:hypothetical protein KY290_010042 [Solanum tuberosum]|uniref:Uncharacterized protein n=1 Tax=Solanum tuberosum TaxID=4113 RepID=A0ABQ7VYR0_SOLTU|nr:hypothetical protein KY289_010422 [Solanum tuberosum]KAH0772905.1 hypothetical protein KY290_010042 [Solanum tuberosum]